MPPVRPVVPTAPKSDSDVIDNGKWRRGVRGGASGGIMVRAGVGPGRGDGVEVRGEMVGEMEGGMELCLGAKVCVRIQVWFDRWR